MITIIEDFDKLDNLSMSIKNKLNKTIEKYQCDIYSKEEFNVKSCLGCFCCWLKTPGSCVIKDCGRSINESMIKSSKFIIFTKLTYGSYSPFTKSVLDRSIPNISPFFKTENSEIHHKARYKKYPEFIVVAYCEDSSTNEENTFHKLVKANAINFQAKKYKSILIKSSKDIDKIDSIVGDING